MADFTELEESNLKLIQQWQESEQQTEVKRKEFEKIRMIKNGEIDSLATSVEENKARATKISSEKNNLEMQTSKGNENLMSDSVYKGVVRNIAEIRQLADKKRAKGTNVPDPTS